MNENMRDHLEHENTPDALAPNTSIGDRLRDTAAKISEPRPGNPGIIRKVLSEAVDRIEPIWESKMERAEWIVDRFKDYLLPNATYIDLGSGIGHTGLVIEKKLGSLNTKILNMEPFDRDTRRVSKELAGIRGDQERTFFHGFANRIPVADKSVEGTLLIFVLHHMDESDQEAALMEAKRVSIKTIIIDEDLPSTHTEVIDIKKNTESTKDRHHYRSVEDWETLFQRTGLKVAKREIYDTEETVQGQTVKIPHASYVLEIL